MTIEQLNYLLRKGYKKDNIKIPMIWKQIKLKPPYITIR